MTQYLHLVLKMGVEVSTHQRDRQGNEIPRHVRFHLIDRWVMVPGHLVAIQQSRRDAPTLFTHTIFGPKENAPLFAESDDAVLAAVREYLRRGVGMQGEPE